MTHLLDCEEIQREFLDTNIANNDRTEVTIRTVANFLDRRTNCWRGRGPEGGVRGNGVLPLLGVEVSMRGSDIRSNAWQAAKHERSRLEDGQDGKQQSESTRSQVEEMVQHATFMARVERRKMYNVSVPISREHTDTL